MGIEHRNVCIAKSRDCELSTLMCAEGAAIGASSEIPRRRERLGIGIFRNQ